jgi:hypothetical protein
MRPALDTVPHVVRVGPEVEVIRVDTQRRVALVQDLHPWWHHAFDISPYQTRSVNFDRAPLLPNVL